MEIARTQRTLANNITITGRALHGGDETQVSLYPAEAGNGITWQIEGVEGVIRIGEVIPVAAPHATVMPLGSGGITTIEHIMAALYAAQIDTVSIVLSSPEPPAGDGSARLFYNKIIEAGVCDLGEPRTILVPKKELVFTDSGCVSSRVDLSNSSVRSITITPHEKSVESCIDSGALIDLECHVDFREKNGPQESYIGQLSLDRFVDECVGARTCGFLADAPLLRRAGLAQGATLENSIVIGPDGQYVNQPRFEHEFVRHKVLDLVGDLYLMGHSLCAQVVANRPGHSLTRRVIEHAITHPDAWEHVQI